MSKITNYYRKTSTPHSLLSSIQEEFKNNGYNENDFKILSISTENCYYVQTNDDDIATVVMTIEQQKQLEWLLAETFEPEHFTSTGISFLQLEQKEKAIATTSSSSSSLLLVEFGPRMTFTSAFSSNAVSICQSCHLPVSRLELSRRYLFHFQQNNDDTTTKVNQEEPMIQLLKSLLHDRMTEEEYVTPLSSFASGAIVEATKTIPIMEKGRSALEEINTTMGLGFDDFDLDYYTKLFKVRTFFFGKKSLKNCVLRWDG